MQRLVEIVKHLEEVSDPRVDRTKRHNLCMILFSTLVAVVCGATSFVDVADFTDECLDWLSEFVDVSGGAPSHDTYSRVFASLNPEVLTQRFVAWMQAIEDSSEGRIVAIDGKRVRRSFDTACGAGAIHMVSAWSSENSLVLAQIKVDEKSNEITAIPPLLEMLYLKGAVVTIDAMGTQRQIAADIVANDADYVLCVKGNQPELQDAVTFPLDEALNNWHAADNKTSLKTVDADHGRIEERRYVCVSADAIDWSDVGDRWSALKSLCAVERHRTLRGKTTVERQYYISSLPNAVRPLAKAIRSHWSIENGLHWVLDVDFQEDLCRVRKNNGPQNLAVVRHMAVNIFNQEKSTNHSLRRKRLKAARNFAYLEKLLGI